MLSELPSEILYCVVAALSTAKDVINLAQTCRRLYEVISAENYRIFRAFVQSRFSSIATPPLWRDAALALTSRSRAFDRKAIIGRFVLPPGKVQRIGHPSSVRTDRPTLGYRPVIDSYETWYGGKWNLRKEVLVWGAGAEIVMRISDVGYSSKTRRNSEQRTVTFSNCGGRRISNDGEDDPVTWVTFNDLHGVDSWDDVSGIHLIPSHQTQNYEEIIFGRRTGGISRMTVCPSKETSQLKKRYISGARSLEKTDISRGPNKVLAASIERRSISFFRVDDEGDEVHPFWTLKTAVHGSPRHKCSRLLSDERIAIGSDGVTDKLSIYDIGPDSVTRTRDIKIDGLEVRTTAKAQVQAIEPILGLHGTGMREGDLFLTGWHDSKIRLHDLRCQKSHVSLFTDTVDDSPIYSMLPIGQERFLVGSGVNALLKIFDMRMPGRYSYLDTGIHQPKRRISPTSNNHSSPRQIIPEETESITYPRKDISLFLSTRPPSTHSRVSLFREPHRYRGPVYTLSTPSPSSSSIYVGVEAGVIRLDVTATDDLSGPLKDWHAQNISLWQAQAQDGRDGSKNLHPFELSCYERPLMEDQGRGVRLMMQDPLPVALENRGERIKGWDRRWFQPWVANNRRLRGPWRRPS